MINRFLAIAIVFAAAFSSCKKENQGTLTLNPCGLDFSTTISYAAIGDEFSSGLFLADGEAWPHDVASHVEGLGYDVNQFAFIGINGDNTNEVLTSWNTGGVSNCKNLATIMVGTHDLLAGRTVQQFKSDYTALVSNVATTITELTQITCVTLPDYSQAPGLPASAGTPAEVLQLIQAYNTAIQEVAADLGVQSVDIFPPSQVSYNATLAEDDFHPNADQHSLWANSISFAVENGLAE